MSKEFEKKVKFATKIIFWPLAFPISVSAMHLWPWWTKQSKVKQVITAPFVLPFTGIAHVLTVWWSKL
jgi:ABC-type molybdate transport system permease subunit